MKVIRIEIVGEIESSDQLRVCKECGTPYGRRRGMGGKTSFRCPPCRKTHRAEQKLEYERDLRASSEPRTENSAEQNRLRIARGN